MRWTRSLAAGAASSLVVLAAIAATPKMVANKGGDVQRGKYLVSISGCNDCHTPGTFYGAPDTSRMLSGSELGWAGPGGVVYAANLTPDKATGLGQWSLDEIVKTIRTGNRPDGRQLAPIMPWINLANLTDADAYAIAAYLKSIPAVSHRVPAPVAAGQKVEGPVMVFPPPSGWDAPKGAPDHQ